MAAALLALFAAAGAVMVAGSSVAISAYRRRVTRPGDDLRSSIGRDTAAMQMRIIPKIRAFFVVWTLTFAVAALVALVPAAV